MELTILVSHLNFTNFIYKMMDNYCTYDKVRQILELLKEALSVLQQIGSQTKHITFCYSFRHSPVYLDKVRPS
jgi:hypothetical protein